MAAAAVVAGLLAIVAAVVLHRDADRDVRVGAVTPIVDRGAVPGSTSGPGTTRTGERSPAAAARRLARVPAGSRLIYGRLHVHAPITHVQVVDGVMDVPRNPRVLGWWSGSARPGATAGTVVVVGHINYAGTTGALATLPDARPGDVVTLHEPGSKHRYRVAAVRTYPKTKGIPQSVFRTSGVPRLALITCGGSFDPSTGSYRDNIVAYAVPVRAR